jgi:hypothetical protein
VRRGAAWPTERPSSCLVVGEQEHGWASSVRSLGKEAQEVRTPAVLSSPCPRRCPVRASSVPRVAVRLIGVRCPVRVSERPGVQCPASGLRRPVSVPSSGCCGRPEWSWCVAVGQAVVRLGWPGRGGRPPCPRRRVVCARLDRGARGWRRPCWASGGSAWTWSSSWAVVQQWPLRAHGRLGEAGCARIARRSAAGGDHAAWSWCEALGRVAWSLRAFPVCTVM